MRPCTADELVHQHILLSQNTSALRHNVHRARSTCGPQRCQRLSIRRRVQPQPQPRLRPSAGRVAACGRKQRACRAERAARMLAQAVQHEVKLDQALESRAAHAAVPQRLGPTAEHDPGD